MTPDVCLQGKMYSQNCKYLGVVSVMVVIECGSLLWIVMDKDINVGENDSCCIQGASFYLSMLMRPYLSI